MCDEYSTSVMRVVVAHICKTLGWDSMQSSALEVLLDLAERHCVLLGKHSQRYAEQFGHANTSLDDLNMAFTELNVSTQELQEYMRNTDPIRLSQTVYQFPIPSEDKLIYPEYIDDVDENRVYLNHDVNSLQVPPTTNLSDSPGASSKKSASAGLALTSSKHRLAGELETNKFRMRSQQMLEGGDLSDLFSLGKLPSSSKPPQSASALVIPKMHTEPTYHKTKLKAGAFKPAKEHKQEVKHVADSGDRTVKPLDVSRKDRIKKKSAKKKAKRSLIAPEGFQDIFGTTLEKPKGPPALPRDCSVSLEKIDMTSPNADMIDDSPEHDLDLPLSDDIPDVDEDDPTVKKRLENWDDTLECVLRATREEISRSEKAEQAFSFDDRPVTPVEMVKVKVRKSPSQGKSPLGNRNQLDEKLKMSEKSWAQTEDKPRSKADDRSKSQMEKSKTQTDDRSKSYMEDKSKTLLESKSKPHLEERSRILPDDLSRTHVDDTIDAVLRGNLNVSSNNSTVRSREIVVPREESPPPKKIKSRDKAKKKSKREQLLEQFAAAPMPYMEPDVDKVEIYDPDISHEVVTNEQEVPFEEPAGFSESPVVAPVQTERYDSEDEEVNIEDSDSESVSHAPAVQQSYSNPHQSVRSTTAVGSPPPAHVPPSSYLHSPMSTSYTLPSTNISSQIERQEGLETEEWEVFQPGPPIIVNFEDDGPSECVDMTLTSERKEKKKHKKEKKEKRDKSEKKKKKHKHKDEERRAHKHRQEDQQAEPEGGEEVAVPRLTLKIGGLSGKEEAAKPAIPKLVIKPLTGGPGSTYPEPSTPLAVSSQTVLVQADFGITSLTMDPVSDKIWICPACGRPDDGSPMIGCDACDEWYHWPCVGIMTQPAEDVEWYCPGCAKKGSEKSRKKKRKKHKHE